MPLIKSNECISTLKACNKKHDACLHAVLEEVGLHVVDEAGGGLPAVHHPRQAVLAVLQAFLGIGTHNTYENLNYPVTCAPQEHRHGSRSPTLAAW